MIQKKMEKGFFWNIYQNLLEMLNDYRVITGH
jgi:hypothetical protein